MGSLQVAIEEIWVGHRKADETPAETVRRLLLEGGLSEDDLVKRKGVGSKGVNFLLFLLGLRTDKVVKATA